MRVFLVRPTGERMELVRGRPIVGTAASRIEIEYGDGFKADEAGLAWLACNVLTRLTSLGDPFEDTREVTPEWCEAAGLSDSATTLDMKRFEIMGDAIRILFHACAGPKCWEPQFMVGKIAPPAGPTRGRILRLGALLGRGWPLSIFEYDRPTFEPQTKLGELFGREGTIAMDKPSPEAEPEASGPQRDPNAPDIPGIYACIRRLAVAQGLTIPRTIDLINQTIKLDPLRALQIKVQVLEFWEPIAHRTSYHEEIEAAAALRDAREALELHLTVQRETGAVLKIIGQAP